MQARDQGSSKSVVAARLILPQACSTGNAPMSCVWSQWGSWGRHEAQGAHNSPHSGAFSPCSGAAFLVGAVAMRGALRACGGDKRFATFARMRRIERRSDPGPVQAATRSGMGLRL